MKVLINGKEEQMTLIEIKYGVPRKGPKKCLHCQEAFVPGDCWHKIWDPEHVYAVGIHTKCLAVMNDGHGKAN